MIRDRETKVFRYATQDDIRRMERICRAYDNLILNIKRMAEDAESVSNG